MLPASQLGLAARYVVVAALAYLLGGIPWALIIGKGVYGIDVRNVGSGNLGATNVLRNLGAKAAAATLLLDMAKGAAAAGVGFVLVSVPSFGEAAHQWAMILGTLGAMLGHAYSPYIGFKGGKGVATAAGALLVVTPYAWPFLLGSFIIVVLIFRIVSLGSVIIAAEYPILCWVLYPRQWPIIVFSFVGAALVIWRHRTNIARIVRGEEPKISLPRRKEAE